MSVVEGQRSLAIKKIEYMMSKPWLVLACVCLVWGFASFLAVTEGAQCTVHPDNSCRATCNGSEFDISKVFNYPINITGKYYSYLWDPCNSVRCPDAYSSPDVAICQRADQFYNCGTLKQPIWLFNYRYDHIEFAIQYPWGTDWRITEIRFIVDESMDKPTIEFIDEKPGLQYNFVVSGKCVGQVYNGCT